MHLNIDDIFVLWQINQTATGLGYTECY